MLTNARRSQSLPRKTEQCFVARRLRSNNRLSLRLRDAPISSLSVRLLLGRL